MSEFDRPPSPARRRFLSSTAVGGLGVGLGLLAGTRAAHAWSVQPMDVATHKLYADRCRVANDGYHEALAAAERERLAGTMSETQIADALAAMRCPICGCPIMAAATPAAGDKAKAG